MSSSNRTNANSSSTLHTASACRLLTDADDVVESVSPNSPPPDDDNNPNDTSSIVNPSDNTNSVDTGGASEAATAIDAAMVDLNNNCDNIAAAASSLSSGITNNGIKQMSGGAPDPPIAMTDTAATILIPHR